ncbi:ABC transporter substrate-binding protein [Nocardioides marmorisolisilvae]|uniref:Extracellular solute-binding protein n=1 Tax=Nocardioides marmorisolisilvae TaxID=1542737 RepID=A0A3N0DPR4_9ACTN|nr:extracellular solute-binding protein [Nocardioides marmorisolisilvae]RNL77632.1 extracellular solute-binding protein [Nocardioides marmorisolisilvae]
MTAAALTAAALTLTGCGGGGGQSADSGKKVELRMLANISLTQTEDFWNKTVAPFEKANNVDVKIVAPGADGLAGTLTQLLASGDVPDVVEWLAPSAKLAPELVDLSKYDWAKNGPLAEQNKVDGKYYTAGVGENLQSTFFYNKKAFADAGITQAPATMDEFEADLAKLKAAGWVPLQTGGEWFSNILFQYISLPNVLAANPDWHKKMSSGDLTFSQTFAGSAKRYADWLKAGYVPKDAVGVKYADAEANFLAGKVAIYPMGSWFAAAEKAAPKKPDIGVFSTPVEHEGDTPRVAAALANTYLAMKASKHQDLAIKLIKFMTTDKTAITEQLSGDGIFRAGYDDYPMDQVSKDLQKLISDTPAEDFVSPGEGSGDTIVPAGFTNELNTDVQAMMTGKSADDFLHSMDDWFASNR